MGMLVGYVVGDAFWKCSSSEPLGLYVNDIQWRSPQWNAICSSATIGDAIGWMLIEKGFI